MLNTQSQHFALPELEAALQIAINDHLEIYPEPEDGANGGA